MINFLTIQLLKFFDYFYKIKILNFIKRKNLSNLETFFDVGAHEGESIDFFLSNLKIKKIYSFEASPVNYTKLKKKIPYFENKFKKTKIIIENIALGSEEKKIKFKQFNESSSSTFSDINQESSYFKKKYKFLNKKIEDEFFYEIEKKIVPLISYLDENKIDHVDFLKIDTEGYEFEVLNGLKEKIKDIRIIFFEHHYDNMIKKNYKFSDINKLLTSNNFKKIYKSKMPFRKTFEYIYINDSFNKTLY